MALRSVVFKAELGIADLDRHYYQDHAVTLARHPSETDERMMVRVLAFILNASESLEFGKGLSSDDEPALWARDLTGAITQWIEVGLPDERVVRKACARSEAVIVYAYGRTAELWWKQNAAALSRYDKLQVWWVPADDCAAMVALVERGMQLQCTLQDGELMIAAERNTITIRPKLLSAI